MVKKLFILMLSGAMLFSLIGCINNYEEYEKTSSESIEDEYATEQSDIENNIPMQEEKPELPDSLFFMRNFDYVMNDDGTYSFVGYITDCKMSAYSLSPTIYITTSNGEGYSTSESEGFNKTYIGRNGEISVILNDMLYNMLNLQGIPFTFIYSNDGYLKDIILPEPYRYDHYAN